MYRTRDNITLGLYIYFFKVLIVKGNFGDILDNHPRKFGQNILT